VAHGYIVIYINFTLVGGSYKWLYALASIGLMLLLPLLKSILLLIESRKH